MLSFWGLCVVQYLLNLSLCEERLCQSSEIERLRVGDLSDTRCKINNDVSVELDAMKKDINFTGMHEHSSFDLDLKPKVFKKYNIYLKNLILKTPIIASEGMMYTILSNVTMYYSGKPMITCNKECTIYIMYSYITKSSTYPTRQRESVFNLDCTKLKFLFWYTIFSNVWNFRNLFDIRVRNGTSTRKGGLNILKSSFSEIENFQNLLHTSNVNINFRYNNIFQVQRLENIFDIDSAGSVDIVLNTIHLNINFISLLNLIRFTQDLNFQINSVALNYGERLIKTSSEVEIDDSLRYNTYRTNFFKNDSDTFLRNESTFGNNSIIKRIFSSRQWKIHLFFKSILLNRCPNMKITDQFRLYFDFEYANIDICSIGKKLKYRKVSPPYITVCICIIMFIICVMSIILNIVYSRPKVFQKRKTDKSTQTYHFPKSDERLRDTHNIYATALEIFSKGTTAQASSNETDGSYPDHIYTIPG